MTTGFIWHEVYGWHDTGTAGIYEPTGPPVQPALHVESPESKQRLAGLVEVSGLGDQLQRIAARPADRDERPARSAWSRHGAADRGRGRRPPRIENRTVPKLTSGPSLRDGFRSPA